MSGKRIYRCNYCEVVCHSLQEYTSHSNSNHPTRNMPFQLTAADEQDSAQSGTDIDEIRLEENVKEHVPLRQEIRRDRKHKEKFRRLIWKVSVLVLCFALVILATCFATLWSTSRRSSLLPSDDGARHEEGNTASLSLGPMAISQGKPRQVLDLNWRDGSILHECQGSTPKKTFPDLGYALYGYNILRGYPLAVGRDPGFTYPIFRADYSSNRMTADCRYQVPDGIYLLPDVSCVTSFSSKVIRSQYELQKSLSVSAHVGGGAYGVSFSASAGYKKSSSEMSSGETTYIMSTAGCKYYESRLSKYKPPPFDDVFLMWVYRLNNSNEEETYMEFMDYFGTHYPTDIKFGARFSYEHKMKTSQFEKMSSSGVNVAVSASYSGVVSVSGGFNLDSSQREKASSFSKEVETNTITVGAPPPANGDAMTWASTVKDTPVPVEYSLQSIEDLFTGTYMTGLQVNFTRIKNLILGYKSKYCMRLKQTGEVNSCEALTPGLMLDDTRIWESEMRDSRFNSITADWDTCVEECSELYDCVAVSYCKGCREGHGLLKACYLYKESDIFRMFFGQTLQGIDDYNWKSTMFLNKLRHDLVLHQTEIVGLESSSSDSTATECKSKCMKDTFCIAFSFCACQEKSVKCKLYSENNIKKFKTDNDTATYIISTRMKETITTSTTTTATTTT